VVDCVARTRTSRRPFCLGDHTFNSAPDGHRCLGVSSTLTAFVTRCAAGAGGRAATLTLHLGIGAATSRPGRLVELPADARRWPRSGRHFTAEGDAQDNVAHRHRVPPRRNSHQGIGRDDAPPGRGEVVRGAARRAASAFRAQSDRSAARASCHARGHPRRSRPTRRATPTPRRPPRGWSRAARGSLPLPWLPAIEKLARACFGASPPAVLAHPRRPGLYPPASAPGAPRLVRPPLFLRFPPCNVRRFRMGTPTFFGPFRRHG
jgi:hypothetical protein